MLAQGLAMNAAPRQRRASLTDKQIAAKRRKPSRYIQADPEQRGLYLRIPPEGPIVFAAVARDPYGKQVWATLGTTADMKIAEARERAREAIRRVKDGLDAIEPPKPKPESVAEIAENWLRRHVEKNKHRTAGEMRRQVDKYILPYWRDRIFTEITRRDVAALLDTVEDKHGPAMADAILTTLRSIAGWVQKRDDDYVPPFVRGMNRVPAEIHKRSRMLTDDELRRVWDTAGEDGQFGAFVRLLLLTAQRRDKVADLRWDDIDAQGEWTIRTEEREKGNPGKLQLPKVARDLIEVQPRFVGNPYVFAGKDGHALRRNSQAKERFDAKCKVKDWRLHDLRRTARSLMSRAGVLSEHAERVLGHAIAGVEGIYNRHSFDAEKADALRKLATLVERIVTPPAKNVVPLTGR
jgi:integrase